MTPAGWLVALFVLGTVALYAWSAHLEHRYDEIEQAKRRHPSRRRDEGES